MTTFINYIELNDLNQQTLLLHILRVGSGSAARSSFAEGFRLRVFHEAAARMLSRESQSSEGTTWAKGSASGLFRSRGCGQEPRVVTGC